jgi:PTH1 family peptidyl-tRNA hydrolase
MLAVIGLGNPGSEYETTRHNVGFRIIDAIAKHLQIRIKAGKGDYLIGEKDITRSKVVLVKPLTYMNNSGLAVRDIVERYSLQIDELLIIVDDFNLPFGTLRLRMSGSDGGHNGLYSIIYHLNSEDFPRLRCGIGPESKTGSDMIDFVLSPFNENELTDLRDMIMHARDAVICAATGGYTAALNCLSKKNI